jgi:hypothetical protein
LIDDPHEEVRSAALLTLDACDPEGKAGWTRLAEELSAVDWRGYIYLANRMHDVFALELTDSGFREIAKNVVNLPVCFYSHADPVLHGKRLYYRTWGHMFCFEAKQP